MKPKDFAKIRERDRYCLHCGETEAISPNHRANRGMGGSKRLDVPSNIVLLCSVMNGLIESDNIHAATAITYGWKISKYANPKEIPVVDAISGVSYLLDDNYGRKVVAEGKKI